MSQDLDQQVRKAVADFCRQAPRRYPFFSIVLGILIIVLIIWFIPQWQVPVSGLSLKDRLHQINENRKTVAQIVGGVFILVGLYIAWVRSKAMRDQAEVDREQQLTDLYVKAIEQLGSENLQIRLGGIYALERIARESPKDHWPIMEVLTAFVRENAPLREEALSGEAAAAQSQAAPEAAAGETQTTPETSAKAGPPPPREKPPTDIQAVLTVLGRTAIAYAQKGETRSLDLCATHLAGADLRRANLQGALLINANLQKAHLSGANLQEARLSRANLQEANLRIAKLMRVYLVEANLQRADLTRANLHGVALSYANLLGANFHEANLQGANLEGAKIQTTILHDADLRGAYLNNAKGLNIKYMADAIWDEATRWPEGFSPPPPRNEEDDEGE